MEKVKWDLTKEKFLSDVKSVMICNFCGWLIHNPRKADEICCNCGKFYIETNSKEQNIRKEK